MLDWCSNIVAPPSSLFVSLSSLFRSLVAVAEEADFRFVIRMQRSALPRIKSG